MGIQIIKRFKMLFSPSFDEMIDNFMAGNEVVVAGTGPVSQEVALRYSAFFACLRVLSETFASVPFFEYKKLPNGDREQTNDTGYFDIWHGAANSEMCSYNFKEALLYQINLGGNGICERQKNRFGDTVGLYPIEWQRVEVKRNTVTKRLIYVIDGDRTLSREDVFHVPGPSVNGVMGMSILEYAASAIKLGSTYETYGQKFYANGATPSGVFETPDKLNDESFKRLRGSIAEEYTGLEKSGTPMLLEGGLKYNPLTIKPVDAELLESKKFSVVDVCRFCRVQPHMVQALESATNNNIEHQSLEFIMYTMLPHFKRVEENINTQLLTKKERDEGYYFEANIASLLRGDQKSMSESFATGKQWGWLSSNDIRRMLNMNKIAGGDTYLEPLNMKPVGTPAVPQEVPEDIKNEIIKIMEGRT